jgi:hypothetical protein
MQNVITAHGVKVHPLPVVRPNEERMTPVHPYQRRLQRGARQLLWEVRISMITMSAICCQYGAYLSQRRPVSWRGLTARSCV